MASAGATIVPIIDIGALFGQDQEARLATAKQIGHACKDIGFFVIVGHQVDQVVIDAAWTSTRAFFDTSLEHKQQFVSVEEGKYPFGYSGVGFEVLSAGKAAEDAGAGGSSSVVAAPPDLKEMFSLGPRDPAAGFPPRQFPSSPASFAAAYTLYYDTMAGLAHQILRAFALALELPDESFFEQFCDHHASAMRAINYPAIATAEGLLPGQLRASAHTDYGTITLLKSDGPGLQVSKDTSPPSWHDVPHVEGGFIVNLGDLMRRWTNDCWLSTLHRVVVPSSEVSSSWVTGTGALGEAEARVGQTLRRQSIAFFHNLNRDAEVRVLLRGPEEVPKHAPIVAGDFLMQKHLASVNAAAQKSP
jgi:isopenicillin N synthase-like dioxygenase